MDTPLKKNDRRRQSRGRTLLLAVAGVGAFLVLVVLGPWGSRVNGSAKEYSVRRGDLRASLICGGTLKAENVFRVSAPMGGVVAAIRVEAGTAVREGDPLVELDNPEAHGRVRELEAERSRARLEITRSENRLLVQLNTARGNLKALEGDLVVAEADFARTLWLVEEGIKPESERRREEIRVEQLQGRIELERASLEAMRRAHEAELGSAAENLAVVQERLALAEEAEKRLRVLAPEAGVVQEVLVELGEMSRGGEPLLKIVGDGDLAAVLWIPEGEAARVRVGQSVTIRVGQEFSSGRLTTIAPSATDGLVEARASTEIWFESARPDLSVSGEIETGKALGALLIDRPAGVRGGSTCRAGVKGVGGGDWENRELVLGEASREEIQIISGASDGEKIRGLCAEKRKK